MCGRLSEAVERGCWRLFLSLLGWAGSSLFCWLLLLLCFCFLSLVLMWCWLLLPSSSSAVPSLLLLLLSFGFGVLWLGSLPSTRHTAVVRSESGQEDS